MLHIVVASGNANTTNASPSVVPSYFEPHMSHHKRTVCPAKDVTKYLNKEETKNQCRIFQCRILSFFFFFFRLRNMEQLRVKNREKATTILAILL